MELVTDYLERSLEDDLRRETDEHLAECAHCQLYLDQMQTIIRVLGTMVEESHERAPG